MGLAFHEHQETVHVVLTFMLSSWTPEDRGSREILTSGGIVSSEGWVADIPVDQKSMKNGRYLIGTGRIGIYEKSFGNP